MKSIFGRWLRALPACAVAALFLIGVAGADNSTFFSDASGRRRLVARHYGARGIELQRRFRLSQLLGHIRGSSAAAATAPACRSLSHSTSTKIPIPAAPSTEPRSNSRPTTLTRRNSFVRTGGTSEPHPGRKALAGGAAPPEMCTRSIRQASAFHRPWASTWSPPSSVPRADTAPDIRTFNYQPVRGTPPPNPTQSGAPCQCLLHERCPRQGREAGLLGAGRSGDDR